MEVEVGIRKGTMDKKQEGKKERGSKKIGGKRLLALLYFTCTYVCMYVRT